MNTATIHHPTWRLPVLNLLLSGAAATLAVAAITTDDVGTDAPAPAIAQVEVNRPTSRVETPTAHPVATIDPRVYCEPQKFLDVPC